MHCSGTTPIRNLTESIDMICFLLYSKAGSFGFVVIVSVTSLSYSNQTVLAVDYSSWLSNTFGFGVVLWRWYGLHHTWYSEHRWWNQELTPCEIGTNCPKLYFFSHDKFLWCSYSLALRWICRLSPSIRLEEHNDTLKLGWSSFDIKREPIHSYCRMFRKSGHLQLKVRVE